MQSALTDGAQAANPHGEMRFCLLSLLALSLVACGPSGGRGAVDVAMIGDAKDVSAEGVRLSSAAQHLRAATYEGLVMLDPSGQVIPAIAERWIVADDGMSYIFRIRNSNWANGDEITAARIRNSLRDNLRKLRGTSFGLDLAKVEDVRAMTGRVIEIRLTSPMPDFLRLLAQPEMGFTYDGEGAGPMTMTRDGETGAIELVAMPPDQRGLPALADWESLNRPVNLQVISDQAAVDGFANGDFDLVLNGRLANLPLADIGPLSRGTVRIEASLGLMGLTVRNAKGVLSEPELRNVLSAAIDRSTLMQPFNIGGWQSSTWIVPRNIPDIAGPRQERWVDLPLDQRRQIGLQKVRNWEKANSQPAEVTIGLPPGPGSDVLFAKLEQDFLAVGVDAKLVPSGTGADLEFHDRVARFLSPRWYLNQFNCGLRKAVCSPEADELIEQSLVEIDPQVKARLMAEAEMKMLQTGAYIPLGSPIRWSLVRGNVAGFQENQWGMHPLFSLAAPTI